MKNLNMKRTSKILIVEDDALTAVAIRDELGIIGYEAVDIAITYDQAISSIKTEQYDLILLDVDLKGEYTGIDIANEEMVLNKIPVIYLTSYTDNHTINELIATNPKGYLSKPLKYEELKVTIFLALGHKKSTIDIGDNFTYNQESKKLYLEQKAIKLSKNETRLLERLIEGRGEVVPSNILEFEIWGNNSIAKNALTMLVISLRTKLKPKRIENIVAEGYRLS